MNLSTHLDQPGQIRFISHTETYPLRHLVLRPGRPLSSCKLPMDESTDSIHIGVFLPNQQSPSGIVSLHPENFPDILNHEHRHCINQSWRIRAMAIHPKFQKKGLGFKLIQTSVNEIINRQGTMVWCNARSHAIEFYQKCGFKSVGQEFIIQEVGPHFKMIKTLEKPEKISSAQID